MLLRHEDDNTKIILIFSGGWKFARYGLAAG
jgi:hypothetical protein